MPTLQLEHEISDFKTWKRAFDADPAQRAAHGVRAHRVGRPLGEPNYVVVDLDFDSAERAQAFRAVLDEIWSSAEAAPALIGTPQVRIVETVENETY